MSPARGYGILWDNTSFTRFGDLRPFVAIPPANLIDADGKPGGLTLAPIDDSQPPTQSSDIGIDMRRNRPAGGGRPAPLKAQRWQGSILAPVTGDYQFQAYSNGGIQVWFDGKLVMNHWRQNWNSHQRSGSGPLLAGHKYPIKIENDPEQQSTLASWKTPPPSADTPLVAGRRWRRLLLRLGPIAGSGVAGYRILTGRATMLPRWAFGLWQSRQRYQTADQLLDVVDGFRRAQIPFDNIVQDWQYWDGADERLGLPSASIRAFPGPGGHDPAVHDLHAHLMISVWGKFYAGTDNFAAMDGRDTFISPRSNESMTGSACPTRIYDPFNPGARKMFWIQVDTACSQRHRRLVDGRHRAGMLLAAAPES